ncbi:MAG: hypothetical protein GC154_00480 [bacterium]|nr:hypothetical protein [bacterium]
MLRKPPGASSPVTREERRSTNEPCLWCRANTRVLSRGTIANESATGLLLRTSSLPNVKDTIHIIPLIDKDSAKLITSVKQLKEHPLMRTGIIVRRESIDSVGVQFIQDETPRPEYRRWYRGDAEIMTLFTGEYGVIRVIGRLDLESGALLQSVLRNHGSSMRELLITLHNVESMAATVVTLIRSALQQMERNGVDVTCIIGKKTFSAQNNVSPLLLNHERMAAVHAQFELDDLSEPSRGEPANEFDSPPGSKPQQNQSPGLETLEPDEPAEMGPALIAAGNLSRIHRLIAPLQALQLRYEALTKVQDAGYYIIKQRSSFLIIDFEAEECEDLVKFNQSYDESRIRRAPFIIVIGPPYLEPLVREALVAPIKIYLEKPVSDRIIESTLNDLYDEWCTTYGGV